MLENNNGWQAKQKLARILSINQLFKLKLPSFCFYTGKAIYLKQLSCISNISTKYIRFDQESGKKRILFACI